MRRWAAAGAVWLWACGPAPEVDEGLAPLDGVETAQHHEALSGPPAWVQPRPRVWPRLDVPEGAPLVKDTWSLAIFWMQDRLMEYGYLDPDTLGDDRQHQGYFGNWTELGVASFQAWNGLPVTGVADRATLEALAGVPERTPSGRAALEGGVSLAHLDEAQLVSYLRHVYDLNNPGGVPFNTSPGGVNMVQIRGFAEGRAVQNAPNLYNDTLFALVNDAAGQPARVEVFMGSADYAHLLYQIQFWGWWRPYDPALGQVFGPQEFLTKGLGMSAPGRVVAYRLGRHVSGSTGTNRGLGLIDPKDGSASMSFAYVDFNHNGQIDGAEWKHRYGYTVINVHQSGDETRDGLMTAGCHNVPVNDTADYQRFAQVLLESGQVRAYMDARIAAGEPVQQVRDRVWGPVRDGMFLPDGRPVHWGPSVSLPIARVPFALVDARSLPAP